jgi:hypothetical protein
VYCAEHIVLALNVAVNVAHNRRGFQDIWGEVDGAKLWDLLVHRWNNDNQVPVLRPEPSWVDEWLDWRAWVGELSASRFRPWPPAPAPDTGGTWENIPLENSVPEGDEFFRPLWKFEGIHNPNAIATPGRSLAFPAQTTADLSQQFLTQYADWTTVGPVFSTALLMGFMGEIQRRTGISEQRFLELTVGIMAEMFKFDAAMEFSKFIVQRGGALPSGDALAPIAEQFSGQAFTRYRNGLRLVAIPDPVADAIISGASQLAFIQTHAEAWAKQPNEQLRYSWARDQFSRAVRPLFRAAQREPVALSLEAQAIAGVMYVEYYTPPVIAHEMALGSYPSHQRVRFTTIASVFAAADVERSSTPESRRRLCPYQGQELIGEECGVIKP